MKTRLALGLAAALALGSPAIAQQMTFRVADSFPAGHYIPEAQTKVFMAEIEKRSNGNIKFQYFPAEQLGKAKDMMSLALSGVADIAYVAPSFVSDKLPLSVVAELPESFANSCEGTNAYWKLAREGGLLDKLEFEPNGVRALFVLVLAPYQVYMTKGRELTSLESFKGKKIRTTGGAKELAIRKIGAVPVQIPTPEVREAAARGTIDGFLFPNTSIAPYDMARHSSAATTGENFGSFVVTYMISRQKWNALPADVRKMMDEVGNQVVTNGCRTTDSMEADEVAKIKAAGVKMEPLPAADSKRVKALMTEVSQEWAAGLDKRGRKGSEVLKAFQDALSAR
jgi:TRAP-type C4-dicarboxylate transport system substrate-binding protein